MQTYTEQLNVAVIPKDILINQEKYDLSDEELLGLIKILSIKDENDNLLAFLNLHNIKRETITNLEKKGIIQLKNKMGKIEIVYQTPVEKSNLIPNETKTNKVMISKEMIERINFLLNRKLKSHELEKIKSWLNLEYSFQEIEEAINKSILNDADNFNYIEKVLFNNYGSKQQTRIKIERNFELY